MTGRHSSGQKNYAPSGALIAGIIALVLVIGVLVWWFGLRSTDKANTAAEQSECIRGDLVLPVAEEYPGTAAELLTDYSGVVRDYCVRPEVVDSLADAALLVAAASPATDALLADAARSPVADDLAATPAAGEVAVGLYGPESVDPVTVDLANITFPSSTSATTEAAVTAAAALSGSEEEAAQVLSRDSGVSPANAATDFIVGAAGDGTASGEFSPIPNAAIQLHAIVLAPATTDAAAEETARAAEDLASKAAGGTQNPAANAALYQAAATPAAPEAAAVVAEPADTLFLMDTSDQMGPYFDQVAQAIGTAAGQLEAAGRQVAFWNYSSPLNPGVVNPYRANLGYGAGSEVAGVVGRLGTGGVPMTRTSTVAAAQVAHDRATETGGAPSRLVVVTTGTAANDLPDDVFREQLAAALGGEVELAVVTVGEGAPDPVLAEVATSTGSDVAAAAGV